MTLQLKDANLIKTAVLPNGAAATQTTGFDTGVQSGHGDFLARCELLIAAPALVVGDLADGATMTYSVESDNDVAFGSPKIVADKVLIQTGAGGAGAAAASARFRLAENTERYLRVKATNSGAGDASDKSMTVSLCF